MWMIEEHVGAAKITMLTRKKALGELGQLLVLEEKGVIKLNIKTFLIVIYIEDIMIC